MRVTVINFQRARHHAFLPKRDHQHGVDLRRSVGFIIVFNNDFTVVNRLSGGRAYRVIIVAVVVLANADVSQHVVNIGDSDGIRVNVVANNLADLTQRLRVNVAEKRQRFVGDIQRQLGLASGTGLFFPFHTLHQQHDKTDAHATQNHRDTDFRDDIQPQRGRGSPDDNQDHGQRFAQHTREDPGAPALLFRDFTADPAG